MFFSALGSAFHFVATPTHLFIPWDVTNAGIERVDVFLCLLMFVGFPTFVVALFGYKIHMKSILHTYPSRLTRVSIIIHLWHTWSSSSSSTMWCSSRRRFVVYPKERLLQNHPQSSQCAVICSSRRSGSSIVIVLDCDGRCVIYFMVDVIYSLQCHGKTLDGRRR